jgi:hypothetical protein
MYENIIYYLSTLFLPDQEPETYPMKHRKLLGFINVTPDLIVWKWHSCDSFALVGTSGEANADRLTPAKKQAV